MSFKKVSTATIIVLSLAACSNNQPNDIPSITSSSNGIQKNNGNSTDNNGNTSNNNSNTSGNNSNTSSNNSNTSGNATPRVDFSVSYGGLKTNAIEDIQKLAKDLGAPGATVKSYNVTLGNQSSSGSNINLSGYPLKELKLNQNFQETAIANASGNNYTVTRSGKAHIYRQNYSLIAGINPTNTTVRGSGVNESEKLDDTYILIKGQTTQILPTAGKFNYSGIASDGVSQANWRTLLTLTTEKAVAQLPESAAISICTKRLFEKAATPTKSITPKLRDTVFKALPTVAIMRSASSALMRKKSSVRLMTVKSVSPAPTNWDVI